MAGTFVEGWEGTTDPLLDWTVDVNGDTPLTTVVTTWAYGCTHSLECVAPDASLNSFWGRYHDGLPGGGNQDQWYYLGVAFFLPTGFWAQVTNFGMSFAPTFVLDDSGSPIVINVMEFDPFNQWFLSLGGGTSAVITENTDHTYELAMRINSADDSFDAVATLDGVVFDTWNSGPGFFSPGVVPVGLGLGQTGNDDVDGALYYVDTFEWDQTAPVGEVQPGDELPCPGEPSVRFADSPPWRFVVTTLGGTVLTFLDKLAMDRQVTYLLGDAAVHSGRVPSDNPEINIPSNGFPFLSEGNRLIFGFRREGGNPPWVIRFAGRLEQLEDRANSDQEAVAYSYYTAWDPWRYLKSRAVRNFDGSLPGPNGISWSATPASTIALEILRNTIVNEGTVHVDAGAAWDGTGFYAGTITSTIPIDFNIEQGKSVGEAWQDLMATDTIDIVLLPIYDPINRPGYCVEFNCYNQVGAVVDEAIFGWDKFPRSLTGISHLFDGSQRANIVELGAGPGGQDGMTVEETDAASIARYGAYDYVRFYPGQTNLAAVQSLAAFNLMLRKQGKQTVQISPAPERSPLVFQEFYLGDRVPVYASKNLREPIPGYQVGTEDREFYQRVYGIPIRISDDGVETIEEMLTSVINA